jgi:Flp pilus assembly protein TadG
MRARGKGVLRRINRAWRQLRHDSQAVSAIEFALLLPLMVVLYIGGEETGQAIAIYRKVSQTSYTLADLISQYQCVWTGTNSTSSTVASLPDVMSLSSAVMMPYAASGAQMVVAGITNTSGSYKVAWSYGLNSTSWTTNAAPPTGVTIPTGLASSGEQVIVAQTVYTYTSSFSTVMKDLWGSPSIKLGSTVYLRPRLSTTIGVSTNDSTC